MQLFPANYEAARVCHLSGYFILLFSTFMRFFWATTPRSAQQQPVLGTTSPYSPLRYTARGHDFCFCIMQILTSQTKGVPLGAAPPSDREDI